MLGQGIEGDSPAAARRGGAVAVDATDTVLCLHFAHGAEKGSHIRPQSQYNTELAIRNGGWAGGRVIDCPHATLRLPWGEETIVERHRLLYA